MKYIKHALRQMQSCGNCLGRLLLPLMAMLLPVQARAQDIFTGMIVTDGQNLMLERCHAGKTRYRLMAAADAGDPLAQLRGKGDLLQAQLIARYRADGDTHILEVMSVESVLSGKSCHLLDAIEAAFPAREPAQDMIALLQQATEAKGSGDHVAALDAYNRAAAAATQDPAQQDGWGLLLQADLQREIARTMLVAGAGDACPALDQGKAYVEKARTTLSANSDAVAGEAVDGIERQIAAERQRLRCRRAGPPAEIGKADAALAGHYYLSGVMETGSELRLKADGRFDWYISYGSVDQGAQGRWGRDGQTVTLVADAPSPDTPLARADQAFPWDKDVERHLRDVEWSRQAEAIARRCPWGAGVTTAPSIYLPEEHPPAGTVERAKAAGTKQAAESTRDAAARAMTKAVAEGASAEDRDAADTAMNAWYSASHAMEQAHRDAGLPIPDIGTPALPPECRQPLRDDDPGLPPEQWRRGVAALVGDPARELRLSRIGVTFLFGDGHRDTAQTNRGGWAFAPTRKGAAVERLVIAVPQSGLPPATLTIAPLAEGVQTVIVDTQQLVRAPFETMRLTVEGRDLIPDDMPRGRYSRN
ncbi:MAG: hypothetical protein IPG54_12815 [Sphingomonadales bacterium]|jgi:hypothetical protein|nr:hypothetical protein [Sphingomonadales bacterium]MBK9004564.1 hypothetical protein [Sphingomonadales bacterium]MBK9269752.1 hypothetical protein [Sphingomonadales bacterium]MBP6435148.1 hypothetical protein [Sphingorhabdus sp.]